MTAELVLRSQRVVTPAGVRPASVHVGRGKITAVNSYEDIPAGVPVFEAGRSVVMSGVVDTHVHINEPGRTDWEGFRPATQAAAAGGVTTLLDMPLNSVPPTTTAAAFEAKLEAAQGQCWMDVGFWGGLVPENGEEIRDLYQAGVFGFKCFLVPSGVPEFGPVAESHLRRALPTLASLGAVLLVHAELPAPIDSALREAGQAPRTQYATWLQARPREAENQAIALLVQLCREFRVRVHVVHLSSSDALPLLEQAKQEGLPITAETCHHYLSFAAEEIPDRATEFKCAPPVREAENRERLWSALGAGLIDFVATDHSPSPPAMKCGDSGDWLRAWGGISSLQLSVPALWTQARKRGYGVEHLAEWLCRGPAQLAGLAGRKGVLAVGADADLVVWNPEGNFRVEPMNLHHRHKLSPYARQTLYGVVEATFLRGENIFADGTVSLTPHGTLLRRGAQ